MARVGRKKLEGFSCGCHTVTKSPAKHEPVQWLLSAALLSPRSATICEELGVIDLLLTIRKKLNKVMIQDSSWACQRTKVTGQTATLTSREAEETEALGACLLGAEVGSHQPGGRDT